MSRVWDYPDHEKVEDEENLPINHHETEPGHEDPPAPSADEHEVVEEPAPAGDTVTVKCLGRGMVEYNGEQYKPGKTYEVDASEVDAMVALRTRGNKQRFVVV